jgi:Domain of unknown function (DUF4112)
MPGSSTSTDPGRAPRRPPGLDPLLERLVFVLDQAFPIPGTSWRIGLDGIVGLLFPGGGDALGAIVSAALVFLAARQGLPRVVVARMVFNVAVDALIGAIPVLGDLFDFGWKANTRNLRLLERHRSGRPPTWRDWMWLWALLGGLVLVVVGAVVLALLAIRALGVGLF